MSLIKLNVVAISSYIFSVVCTIHNSTLDIFLHLVKIVEVNIYQALKVFLSDIFIFVFTLHMIRAGHVPTFFLKSFRSVLERGPSARSFRFCSVLVPFCPISFRSE